MVEGFVHGGVGAGCLGDFAAGDDLLGEGGGEADCEGGEEQRREVHGGD